MSRSYDNTRKRQAIYAFIGVYVAFMLTVVLLEMVRNHDLGYGIF